MGTRVRTVRHAGDEREAPSDMTCGVVARGIGFDTPGMNGEAPSTGSAR